MKIRQLVRERPILYRGRFEVPTKVISRLAVASNHLILAEVTGFNGQVDQYYLAIDNLLSAIIIAKEGTLIYGVLEKHPKTATNPTFKATIRRTLQEMGEPNP